MYAPPAPPNSAPPRVRPQRRARLWVLAVDARLMTQGEIETTGKTISSLKMKCPRDMLPFDSFLLDDSHPIVVGELGYLTEPKILVEKKRMSTTTKKTKASSGDKGNAKWAAQHISSVQKASVLNHKRWASSKWEDSVFCAAHPWFSLLHDR